MFSSKQNRKLRFFVMTLLGVMVFTQSFFVTSNSLGQEYGIDEWDLESEEEDLVLAVFVDNQRLSSGIFAIQKKSRFYLPVSALSEVFGFYVDVDRDRRIVTGWALSEDEEYLIDANQKVLEFNGNFVDLPDEAILDEDVADDDVYVLLEVLNQIWPMILDVNMSALVLRANPDDKLPFQQILERKKRQEKFQEKKELELSVTEEIPPPFAAYPYQLYGKPSLDMSVTAGYDGRLDAPEYSYSLNGVQDLAYASADYSVAVSKNGGEFKKPENVRLRFTRQNIHEGALPFSLEDTQWGDVRLRNRELISTGSGGRGLIFSTRRDNFDTEFDEITIDGVGTPGWEVELYVNNELINFGVVEPDGTYRFEDVGISYGNNRVKAVLYGPQGQVRENIENYFYQNNMVKPGENLFSGGIIEAEKDLIPIDERTNFRPEGLAANIYGARGLSEKLTVFGSANTIKDREAGDFDNAITRNYLTAGAIASLNSTLVQGEVYKEIGAGQAVDVRTLSDFKGFKINTQTSYYKDFESPDAQNGNNAKRFEFDIDVKKIFATAIGSLGLEVGADHLKRVDGVGITSYNTRQSLGLKGTRLTNTTRSNLSDGDHTATTGRINSTTRHNKWRWRNNLNYLLHPDTEVTSVDTELRYGISRDYSAALRLQRNFQSSENIVGVQLSRDFEKFLGSVDANWSSDFGSSILFRATTSFGPYAADGSYIIQSQSMRNLGPVASLVYLDKDYDGEYSAGDEPVPNTKIEVGRRVTREETDDSGYLVELNPPSNTLVDVKVSSASIDDPYLISGSRGYSIYPRPGVMHALELPLIETGAIDGTVEYNTGKPIAGLIIELMDSDGEIIQKSKTASDGYFTFERIPPGSYTIRADPATGFNIPFKHVDLTPDNLFMFGQNIEVVDLSRDVDVDLAMGVEDNGLLKVKDIISVAKGHKEKLKAKKKVVPSAQSKPQIQQQLILTQAPKKVVKFEEPKIAEKASSLMQKIMLAPVSNFSSLPIVQEVQVEEQDNKVRLVMNISQRLDYSLNMDMTSNTIYVEMPYVDWATDKNWNATNGTILNSYAVEKVKSGARLVLNVQNDVKIGASGLLEASEGTIDRLYIDIERK